MRDGTNGRLPPKYLQDRIARHNNRQSTGIAGLQDAGWQELRLSWQAVLEREIEALLSDMHPWRGRAKHALCLCQKQWEKARRHGDRTQAKRNLSLIGQQAAATTGSTG